MARYDVHARDYTHIAPLSSRRKVLRNKTIMGGGRPPHRMKRGYHGPRAAHSDRRMGRVIQLRRDPAELPHPGDDKVRCPSCRRAVAEVHNNGPLVLVQIPCRCGYAGSVLVRRERDAS